MFRYNYDKPGKGVNKRDTNQSRISIFFELLWRKFWKLCKVNMFYLITSIPTFIVTVIIMGMTKKLHLNLISLIKTICKTS